MKTLVVVGHPHIATSVVNKAWTEAAESLRSEDVTVHVLEDAIRADGTFDLRAEQELISAADRIILQFPLYWYMPPGIMVEWMDTVWAEHWAWGEGGDAMVGKRIDAAVSCGAPEVAFRATTLREYLAFVKGSAAFVRAEGGGFHAFYDAEGERAEERLTANVEEYKRFVLDQTSGDKL